MSKFDPVNRIAGEVPKRPYTEVRVWFHDPETMTFKGITIKPSQLPFKVKDDSNPPTEYHLNYEHLSKLLYYDWKRKRMRLNLGYIARIFIPRRTGVAIMQYGISKPVTHVTHVPEYKDLTPQGLLISVKQSRYKSALKSLIGRGLANRKLLIAIVVIVIVIFVVYYLMNSGMIQL